MKTRRISSAWPLWLGLAAIVGLYFEQVRGLWDAWLTKEEYSHGLLIPLVAAYILWERRFALAVLPLQHSWAGVALLLLSLALLMGGKMANLKFVENFSLVLSIAAVVWAFGGRSLLKAIAFPLFLVAMVIPLPEVIGSKLTAEMQLVSSQLGVWVIRLFDIPVFLEGNVIDLGSYKLMVVEACSGLRYLFPLISLGAIVAYFYRGPMWQRVLLIVSTIPITIVTNSFRIGITGILVEHFGIGIAEGFLHDFEGWIVFLFAAFLLLVEVKVFLLIGMRDKRLADAFGLDVGPAALAGAVYGHRDTRKSFAPALVAVAVLAIAGPFFQYLEADRGSIPERTMFSDYPRSLNDWTLKRDLISISVKETLKADDYFLGNFRDTQGQQVNVYMVYYSRQRGGGEVHSPEICLPGGGWKISDSSSIVVDTPDGPVNAVRLVIGYRGNRQVLYYWLQQQGKTFASEHLARASLIFNGLRHGRTDGALVRVSTPVPDDDETIADATLTGFIALMSPNLKSFIPD